MSGPVLIMAGGTGGHVFPALAVAEELRGRGVEVVWLGTRAGLEARVVPAAGIPVEWISVVGLRGKGLGRMLQAPFMLARACWQALGVVRRVQPRVVLGMGGFVTGPGGLMARLSGRGLCVHEQNAVAGLTNRLLARIAHRTLEAFPGSLPGAEHTGNPVRRAIAALPAPAARMAARQGPLRLLVLGGSQGARALNQIVPQALARLPQGGFEVHHQTGAAHLGGARDQYAEAGIEARVEPFIDDMAAAYGWADLVVCRAGALTIAELAAAGVGAVLVPYPYAVDDHQTRNAEHLVAAEAAVLIPEPELTPQRLASLLQELDRARLLAMAGHARALARPEAARAVAEACLSVAREAA